MVTDLVKHSEIVMDFEKEILMVNYLAIPKHWVKVMVRSKNSDLNLVRQKETEKVIDLEILMKMETKTD
jgi:hypothetical protein